MKLQIRLRDEDVDLKRYFESILAGDQAHEVRRLLRKAIKIEQEEQEILENARKGRGQSDI